jgi:two-component system, OmpR family, sensor kinase
VARPSLAWVLFWLMILAALVIFARRDGMPLYLILLGFPVLCGLALVWHSRRERSADAERARVSDENGQLLAIQRRFLQDASHQLRTPITIALGHAELLARDLAGRREQRDIHVVVGELTRLRRLSERLLVIAASEDPEFLSRAPVALDLFAADALRRWQPTAPRGWKLGQLDAVTVPADPERLGLALDALLENAVQHTSPGDVIRLSVAGDRGGSAGLVVEDTGEGIAPAELDHVFERFRTGTGSRGTGLGLALVRAVALGHGGEVRVRSTLGAGSRFELVLPASPVRPVLPVRPVTARSAHPAEIRDSVQAGDPWMKLP